MRITLRAFGAHLTALVLLGLLAGCAMPGFAPRPQRGGANTTTLGGATAPTSSVTTAPENPQTPTTTTIEKTTTREFDAPAAEQPNDIPSKPGGDATVAAMSSDRQGVPRREHSETAPSSEAGSRGAPVAARSTPPRIVRETVTEKATTQIGTAQDLAGIVKTWGAAGAAHSKAILWALLLGLAAWTAWKREWPLIAAVLGIGAVLSLFIAWWVGPVAAGMAALVWAAFHVSRGQLPIPPSTP